MKQALKMMQSLKQQLLTVIIIKAVILAGMDSFPRKQGKNESDDAYEERLDLDLSALFVAMTRAREVLDLVAIGEPSSAIEEAEEFFDRFNYE